MNTTIKHAAKHTPGPWLATKRPIDSRYQIEAADGSRLVTLPFSDTIESDARLIAAAPELLEALKSLFEHCAMMHNQWGEGDNTKQADAAIAAGKAAIARAEGLG
jgi:hypothetical protein